MAVNYDLWKSINEDSNNLAVTPQITDEIRGLKNDGDRDGILEALENLASTLKARAKAPDLGLGLQKIDRDVAAMLPEIGFLMASSPPHMERFRNTIEGLASEAPYNRICRSGQEALTEIATSEDKSRLVGKLKIAQQNSRIAPEGILHTAKEILEKYSNDSLTTSCVISAIQFLAKSHDIPDKKTALDLTAVAIRTLGNLTTQKKEYPAPLRRDMEKVLGILAKDTISALPEETDAVIKQAASLKDLRPTALLIQFKSAMNNSSAEPRGYYAPAIDIAKDHSRSTEAVQHILHVMETLAKSPAPSSKQTALRLVAISSFTLNARSLTEEDRRSQKAEEKGGLMILVPKEQTGDLHRGLARMVHILRDNTAEVFPEETQRLIGYISQFDSFTPFRTAARAARPDWTPDAPAETKAKVGITQAAPVARLA